jgi:hypothetical protein
VADDLDLSSLGSGPVGPMADASVVRARGEQRRRRGQAVVAGAAALVVLAGAGTALSLTRDPSPHSLQIGSTSTPSAEPTATQEPTPSPEATVAPEAVGPELLLQPADAAALLGGTWQAGQQQDSASTLLQACKEADVHGVAGAFHSLDGPGNQYVLSQVVRFEDGRGAAALAAIKADVTRCPSRPEDSEDGLATAAHELVASPAPDAVAVQETSRDCDTCAARVSYWVAVSDLSRVGYVKVPETEQPRLAKWADAVRFRLVCADPSCTRGADTTGAERGPLAAGDRLRIDGIGPVTVGMTLAEAEHAAGQPFTAFKDDLGNGCGFVSPRSGSPDVSFMVGGGHVVRVDVREGSSTRTDHGIGLGSTEAEVEAAYPGRVVVRPHAYTSGHYLRVVSDDGLLVLVLETDGTRVTLMRTGTAEAAGQTEGCA